MDIEIHTRGFDLTDGIKEHAERRMLYAFDWARYLLTRIVVRLDDVNGPRGGKDKRCSIRIPLSGYPDLVIEDIQSDLYVAIDRSVERADRSLRRHHARVVSHARNPPPNRVAEPDLEITTSS